MLQAFRDFFATPARQAAGWSSLGILGLVLAAVGLVLMDRGGDVVQAQPQAFVTATATATVSPTRTPGVAVTASPVPSASPSVTVTAQTRSTQSPQEATSGESQAEPPAPATLTPEATEEPVAEPVVAGGPYCPSISNAAPPNSVFGLLQPGGAPAPAGAQVGLAFDGVVGPTAETAAAGGYRVDYGAAGSACANRVGAAISVIYDGVVYSTGYVVGDNPGGPVRFDISQ